MSSTEDDDCMIKLDANVEVESIVRNKFEEDDDLLSGDALGNSFSASSDEDQPETSVGSSQSDKQNELKEMDITASSDVSDNLASAISDISADSADSNAADTVEGVQNEDSSSKSEKYKYLECRLKDVNCKELIVFCIDMSSDMEKVPFLVTEEVSPLNMIKRAIMMYVHNKHFIDKKHEFSLMILYDTATWVSEFTRDPTKLIETLNELTETLDCSSCDLSSVVQLLTEKYPFIISTDFLPADAHRILRVILIYGRSNCMIEFSNPNDKDIIMYYPSIVFDILYIHEPPSDENKVLEIYAALCNLDYRDKSYIFEVTRSVTKLHNSMGRLLSHPFQRILQKNSSYKLLNVVPDVKPDVKPEVMPEATPEVMPEVMPDVMFDVIAEVTSEVMSDVISEVTSDVMTEVTSDVMTEVTSEVMSDITTEVTSEVTTEIMSDVMTEVTSEVMSDVTSEVMSDVMSEVMSEVTPDVTPDVMPDVKPDVKHVE